MSAHKAATGSFWANLATYAFRRLRKTRFHCSCRNCAAIVSSRVSSAVFQTGSALQGLRMSKILFRTSRTRFLRENCCCAKWGGTEPGQKHELFVKNLLQCNNHNSHSHREIIVKYIRIRIKIFIVLLKLSSV